MNSIITKSDVEKLLTLLKLGLKNGKLHELSTYTSCAMEKEKTYVSLELRFTIDNSFLDKEFIEDDFNFDNQIKDLLK